MKRHDTPTSSTAGPSGGTGRQCSRPPGRARPRAARSCLEALLTIALTVQGVGCTDVPSLSAAVHAGHATTITNLETRMRTGEGRLASLRARRIELMESAGNLVIAHPDLHADITTLWPLLSAPAGRFLADRRREKEADAGVAGPPVVSSQGDSDNAAAERVFSPDAPIQISADTFRGDVVNQSGLFEGHVRFEWGSLTMTCDRLDMSPSDPDTGADVRIVAEGHVQFAWADWRGRAGKITCDPANKTLILEQAPHLEVLGATLSAPRLVIDLVSGNVQCEQCRIQWSMEAPRE